MRTQSEIENMIQSLARTKSDPLEASHRVLVRKLNWHNAEMFINPKHRNKEQKKKWMKHCLLDEEILIDELREIIDVTTMNWFDKNPTAVVYGFYCIGTLLWLMGDKKKELTQLIASQLKHVKKEGPKLLQFLCEQFGFNFEKMVRRYKEKNPKSDIILPGDSDFKV